MSSTFQFVAQQVFGLGLTERQKKARALKKAHVELNLLRFWRDQTRASDFARLDVGTFVPLFLPTGVSVSAWEKEIEEQKARIQKLRPPKHPAEKAQPKSAQTPALV